MPLEAHVTPQQFVDEVAAGTTGFTVRPVVGSHDGLDARFNQYPECRQVRLMKILRLHRASNP